jgi:predicted nucleotidyltransferase
VNKVLAEPEIPSDALQIGRKLMEIVNQASTQLPPAKLEKLMKNSLRDYTMVSYLAALTKTQLALQEKMLSL